MPIGPPSFQPHHLYVGDVPPVPTMPFPPSYPPGFSIPEPSKRLTNPGILLKPPPDPFIEQLLGAMLPESETTKMTVWMIWVTDEDPNSPVWLLESWDENSIKDNREGWTEKVEEAFNVYGGAHVRVTKTTVDYDKVIASFHPVDV